MRAGAARGAPARRDARARRRRRRVRTSTSSQRASRTIRRWKPRVLRRSGWCANWLKAKPSALPSAVSAAVSAASPESSAMRSGQNDAPSPTAPGASRASESPASSSSDGSSAVESSGRRTTSAAAAAAPPRPPRPPRPRARARSATTSAGARTMKGTCTPVSDIWPLPRPTTRLLARDPSTGRAARVNPLKVEEGTEAAELFALGTTAWDEAPMRGTALATPQS